jgi:hypothetical protein
MSEKSYRISAPVSPSRIAAPSLPYLPRDPRHYRPNIGLIACGAITEEHLTA